MEQISAEFKVRALKYHPDKNPGDKKAEETFQKLNVSVCNNGIRASFSTSCALMLLFSSLDNFMYTRIDVMCLRVFTCVYRRPKIRSVIRKNGRLTTNGGTAAWPWVIKRGWAIKNTFIRYVAYLAVHWPEHDFRALRSQCFEDTLDRR